MIKRHTNGKVDRRRKILSAAMAAILLTVLPWLHPVSVMAAEVQSYTFSREELQKIELKELPEYGEVKTADASNGAAIWLAVLLFGTGWLLDRRYLRNREDI